MAPAVCCIGHITVDHVITSASAVTMPGGTHWILRRPSGAMNEYDQPGQVTLKPGESYIHAVRIDHWQADSADPRDQYAPPRFPDI